MVTGDANSVFSLQALHREVVAASGRVRKRHLHIGWYLAARVSLQSPYSSRRIVPKSAWYVCVYNARTRIMHQLLTLLDVIQWSPIFTKVRAHRVLQICRSPA
jgi:hypothetical protein